MSKCELLDLPNFTLVRGVGDYEKNEACVMSAAAASYRMSRGEPIGDATDQLECCCPVIRTFLVRLNDSRLWRDDKHRTEVLMPFVSRLAGTKNTDLAMRRVFMLADWSIRTIAADAMDRAKFDGHEEQAARLRAVAEIVDSETVRHGNDAAAYAYAAADAAASASDAASASAAAYAAHACAATYASAASAYADAAAAAAASAAAYAAHACAATYASAASADAAAAASDAAASAAAYAAHACAATYASAASAYADARDQVISQCVQIIDRMISLSEGDVTK